MSEMIEEIKTNKHFLTSGEASKLLGCSSFWINILIAKGELDTHRIGDKGWHRVSVSSIEQYAERHKITLDWALLKQ